MDTGINQPELPNEPNQPNEANQPNQGGGGGGRPNNRRRRRRGGRRGGGQPASRQNAHSQNSGQGQGGGYRPQGQFGRGRNNQQNRRNQGGQQNRRRRGGRGGTPFVGPMDHSYRNANGGNFNGAPVNGRYRNPGVQQPYAVDGEMQPARMPAKAPEDSSSKKIVCFIDDLFFLAKIQETARKLGVKVEFAKAEKDVLEGIINSEEKPALIIFDLNNANAKPLVTIPKLRSKLKKSTSIVGFLSHLQGDLKLKAQEAGCDMVVPRSAFSQNLPALLRRHSGVDEFDSGQGM